MVQNQEGSSGTNDLKLRQLLWDLVSSLWDLGFEIEMVPMGPRVRWRVILTVVLPG
jgi:hypothetical protein